MGSYCHRLSCWQTRSCSQHPLFVQTKNASSRLKAGFPNLAVEALLKRQVQGRADSLASVQARRPVFPLPVLVEADSVKEVASGINRNTTSERCHENGRSDQSVFLKTTPGEDLNAYEDSEEVLLKKVKEIVRLLRTSKYTTVFTGAGISTSANLPDYRSKNGLWRQKERNEDELGCPNEKTEYVSLEAAKPTLAHQALVELHKRKLICGVVTTNIDGLHRLAAQTENVDMEIIELHGNAFEEVCALCKHVFYRDKPVVQDLQALEENVQSRVCNFHACAGVLKDTVVRFGGAVHAEARAFKKAADSDFAFVLGTSMRVSPACNMPRTVFTQNLGKMVLINRQNTAFEDEMWLHCYASLDRVFQLILHILDSDKF